MRIIFIDFDPLITDYRVYKTALTFRDAGHDILVLGTGTKEDISKLDPKINYKVLTTYFKSLKLNLVIFWIKVFFYLIFKKVDIYYSHDLYPAPVVYILAKLRRKKYIYDSHEYFIEQPGLKNQETQKKIWKFCENYFIKNSYQNLTVSKNISYKLSQLYKIKEPYVVPNYPLKPYQKPDFDNPFIKHKVDISKPIILYQGKVSFENGVDTLIDAFDKLSIECNLVILGNGAHVEELKKIASKKSNSNKIYFIPAVPHSELYKYTESATLGVCPIKNLGESYYYALPNKVFEYLHAELPQVSSDFPEISYVINENVVGYTVIPESDDIAKAIDKLLSNKSIYDEMKRNCRIHRSKFYWESNKNILLSLIK